MATPVVLAKIDAGLEAALTAWEELNEPNDAQAGISVSLTYEGDLASIEALGFETHVAEQDAAYGVVYFKDLPALAAHPGVVWIAAGQPPTINLDTAVHEMRVRALTTSLSDGLWHIPNAGGTLTSTHNAAGADVATGEDVIVAVIDTGIDYTHPMFMSRLTPNKVSRILKIWDQGLTPANVADCPNQSRLLSANTYGVEFDKSEIETALNSRPPTVLAHRDCIGHGTHVAGIAAGGPLPFSSGTNNAGFVGVAPKASLIAVKVLDVPDHIFYRLPTNAAGPEVGWEFRFKDAVYYCLRSAKHDFADKPIVINMSFANLSNPGDGLDPLAVWTDERMNPNLAADEDHFPRRAVIVKAAGNDGTGSGSTVNTIGRRRTARIVVPTAGNITLPLLLRDFGDNTAWTTWRDCGQQPHKPVVGVHFWFRTPGAPLSVKFAFRLPNDTDFLPPSGVSGNGRHEVGFIPSAGPTPSVTLVTPATLVYRANLAGFMAPAVPHSPGSTNLVRRNYMRFFVQPKEVGSMPLYHTGIYEIRITAPAGTEFFLMGDLVFWNSARFMWFEIPDPPPAGVTVTSESSATDTLGRNVITVASYDDLNGNIADSSSRGPLRNFADPASLGAIAAKPDIAAPGVEIMSARSRPTRVLYPVVPDTPDFRDGRRFWNMGGTSMAAPMIAGLAALMLHKNHNLNTDQVRNALLTAPPRAAVDPPSPPASTRAYGAGRVDGRGTHSHTP